jgi:hypothetical protein
MKDDNNGFGEKIVAGRETMKEQVRATFREQKNEKGVKGKDAPSTGKL